MPKQRRPGIIGVMEAQICINGRYRRRPVTGVERYAGAIAARLKVPYRIAAPQRRGAGLRGHLWEQAVLPIRCQGRLLWSPANTGPLAVRRQVLTVHDLSPLEHPEWFSTTFARGYAWLWPRLIPRVRHVITDSDFTRGRLIALLGLPGERITTVRVGVDRSVFRALEPGEVVRVRRSHGLGGDYVLTTGSLQRRKNLSRLLEAWRVVREAHPDWELAVAGAPGAHFREDRLKTGDGVRLLGRIPEVDLPGLYAGAGALVQPSLYEGAGLTVLEAMACGCPVVAAGNTALPEYVGDAGLLFDPEDGREMAAQLRRLIAEPALRAELSARGQAHARGFTWDRAAREVEAVLRAERR